MICKLCPLRRHCFDKGSCETCDLGKAFEGYNKKLKRYKTKNEQLEAENEALRQRLAETENGYEQTLYLERLKNGDLTAEVERSKDAPRLNIAERIKLVDSTYKRAIKEFAERLKLRIDCEYGNKFYRDKCFEEIDSLVKEMTGEQ